MKMILAKNEYTGANYVLRKAYSEKAVIEELEKIKTEIVQCYYNDSADVDGVIIFKEDIDNIFNKRIAELKGEQDVL